MLPGRTYTPRDVIRLLWKYQWLIAGSLLMGAFAGLIVSALAPNMYRSEMLVQIVPQRVPDAYVRSTVTIRTEDRLTALAAQVMSRTQLEKLILEFDLYPAERVALPLQDVVERMRMNIKVDPVRAPGNDSADAFYLRFTYPDAALVTALTGRLGSLFIDENARDRGALAEATNDFLEAQLKDARSRLELQEQKLEQFRVRHSGRLPSQLEFNMQAIQSTQLQLQALVESLARDRDRKLILERLYRDAVAEPLAARAIVPPAPAAQTDASPAPIGLTTDQQLEAARANLAKLALRLTPEHPDIVRATRLVEELERKLKTDVARRQDPSLGPPRVESPEDQQRKERLAQMRAELDSLDRQIAFKESEDRRLRNAVADYQQRIEAVPGIESEWISLTRDYDTLQQAYRDLLAKSEDSKVAANLERRQVGEQFRILDPARIPVRPISPNRPKINAAGAALGLAFGLALVVLIELRDSSFRTESDVVDVLALPVLALVPVVETAADARARRRTRVLSSVAAGTLLAASGYVFWVMELWRYIR